MIGLPHCGSYFFALLVSRAASSLDSVAAALRQACCQNQYQDWYQG
jgi:hypothetical protein